MSSRTHTTLNLVRTGSPSRARFDTRSRREHPLSISLGITLVAVLLLGACSSGSTSPGDRDLAAESVPPKFDAPDDGLYCNIADEAGLNDQPFYGRGVSFADVDGDGDDDVFIANTDGRESEKFGVSALYLNNGDGRYERTDPGISPDDLFATWGGAFGDFDNDGDPDLLITNGGYTTHSNVALYRNEMKRTGRFVNVSAESGISAALSAEARWWGASWDDYDGDGFIDSAIASTAGSVHVMHNNGNGTFSDATGALGIQNEHRDAHTPVWLDLENDGDRDLFIPDMEFTVNHSKLYENQLNQGSGFVDVTDERLSGIYPDGPGIFAAAAADFNQDGFEDLYLGRWSLQDLVLVNNGSGGFTAHGNDIGINHKVTFPITLENQAEQWDNTMGLNVGNFDGGPPKVFIGTGSPQYAFEDIVYCAQLDPSHPAGFRLENCSKPFVEGQGKTRGHGLAFSDTDSDGDTDVIWAHGGHPEQGEAANNDEDARQWTSYFESRTSAGAHTASVFLVGNTGGTDAFGARVKSTADNAAHYDTLRSSQGFSSQSSHTILVDTGKSGFADVEVRWPGGKITTTRVEAQTRAVIYEDGRVESSPRRDQP